MTLTAARHFPLGSGPQSEIGLTEPWADRRKAREPERQRRLAAARAALAVARTKAGLPPVAAPSRPVMRPRMPYAELGLGPRRARVRSAKARRARINADARARAGHEGAGRAGITHPRRSYEVERVEKEGAGPVPNALRPISHIGRGPQVKTWAAE
jgi:hypothetical protein